MDLGHARLWRELEDIEKEPLEGIRIHIHDGSNLQHMCLILSPFSGPFAGHRFHLDVRIPKSYPDHPPRVTMQSMICHPNITSGNVRCDGFDSEYTPAYRLKYLFLQLLCLVSSDFIAKRESEPYDMVEYAAKDLSWMNCKYYCGICGFFGQDLPALNPIDTTTKVAEEKVGGISSDQAGECAHSLLEKLDGDTMRGVLSKVNDQAIIQLTVAYGSMKEFMESNNVLLERNLFCSYTRKSFEEDGTVLGLRMDFEKNIVTEFDPISYEAYFQKNTGNFLPLALSEAHFKRGKGILDYSLKHLSGRNDWSPKTVLESIPVVMDAMAGSFISLKIPSSQKFLSVFFLFYHLLWKLTKEDPALALAVRSKIDRFTKDIKSRARDSNPNLGAFLMYALVDPEVDCSKLGGLVLKEILTRNALAYLKKHPHLAYEEPSDYNSEIRLQQTFQVCSATLKALVFQVNFVHLAKTVDPVELDRRYGFPAEDVSTKLLKLARDAAAVESWSDFLAHLKIPATTRNVLDLLKATMKASEKNGYHRVPYSQNELYLLRSKVEPSCPEPEAFTRPRKISRKKYSFKPLKQKK